jgi:hypothetical protein
MKLKNRIKRMKVKKALRDNAGRIASVAVAFVGVAVWRAMRAH